MGHVDTSVIVALFKINTIDNILKFIVDTRSNKFISYLFRVVCEFQVRSST